MKKILFFIALAFVATAGVAFTTVEDAFDGTPLYSDGGTWVPLVNAGPNCTGAEDACKITILTAGVDPSFFQEIGDAAGTTSTYFVDIDHDEDPQTEDLRVNVRVDARFPIAP